MEREANIDEKVQRSTVRKCIKNDENNKDGCQKKSFSHKEDLQIQWPREFELQSVSPNTAISLL